MVVPQSPLKDIRHGPPALAAALVATTMAALAFAQGNAPPVELGANANLYGRRLLPDDSPWHRDVSRDRVDPSSQRILSRIGLDKPLHADFGTEYEGAPIGIPYVACPATSRACR